MLNCQVIFDPHPSRYYSENDCQGGIAQSQYEVSWVTNMRTGLHTDGTTSGYRKNTKVDKLGPMMAWLQSHILVEYILYGSIAKD